MINFIKGYISYLGYLFEKPFTIRKFFCRLGGHKCGVWFYNPNGLEPDMHCMNCDDDLG